MNGDPHMEIQSVRNRKRQRRARIVSLICLVLTIVLPVVRAADEPLILGIFPRFGTLETITRHSPLAEYLSERLGREVQLVTSKDFDSFWQGVTEQRFDIVHFNQYHYVRAAKTYEVIAHSKEFGKSTMAGALYVRKDSGITDLTQLRGRTVLFGGGEDAMIAYIVPAYLMLRAGLKKEDFKSVFTINPVNSVVALYHKQVDAAGCGDIVVDQPAVRKAINTDELTALAVSEQLLQLPWAVKRTLPAKTREAIQSSLLNLENSEAGKTILKSAQMTGVGNATDKDYDPHRKMIRAVMGSKALAQQ
jgi:phosphonate transport system substrate-binding protein